MRLGRDHSFRRAGADHRRERLHRLTHRHTFRSPGCPGRSGGRFTRRSDEYLALLPIETRLGALRHRGLRPIQRAVQAGGDHAHRPPRLSDARGVDHGAGCSAPRNAQRARCRQGAGPCGGWSSRAPGAIYGRLRKSDGTPIREDDPVGIFPTFIYRSAKMLGEWLGDFYTTHHGVSFVALRFSSSLWAGPMVRDRRRA